MGSDRVVCDGLALPEAGMMCDVGLRRGDLVVPHEPGQCPGRAEAQYNAQDLQAAEQERLVVASIYRPIAPYIAQVEDRLDRLIEAAPPRIADQLAHALKGGGKRLRPALTLLAGSFDKGEIEPLLCAATAVELLHTATLVHDDTIDNAILRRARLTVNRLWGKRDAVFVGDYLCAASACMAAHTGNVQAMVVFSGTLSDLCRGATSEYTEESHHCREEYLATIGGKTAALFRAATQSGALVSGAPTTMVNALREYGYNLGMTFQIVDDIHDVDSDLARGILNLPALVVLEGPRGSDLRECLRRDTQEGLRLLASEVRNTGVLVQCRQIARLFRSRACAALAPLPQNAAYDSLVALAAYLTERDG
jgi:geranylgeranyl pyrophosphate synthase